MVIVLLEGLNIVQKIPKDEHVWTSKQIIGLIKVQKIAWREKEPATEMHFQTMHYIFVNFNAWCFRFGHLALYLEKSMKLFITFVIGWTLLQT